MKIAVVAIHLTTKRDAEVHVLMDDGAFSSTLFRGKTRVEDLALAWAEAVATSRGAELADFTITDLTEVAP